MLEGQGKSKELLLRPCQLIRYALNALLEALGGNIYFYFLISHDHTMPRLFLILFIWFVCLAVIPDWTKVITIILGCWIAIWTVLKFIFKV